MPPSPSVRRSPVMETRGDVHRRGRSLESRSSSKRRDDDLALFDEMQSRETDNFLLQSSDDFDSLLSSRLKPFPDVKLGVMIPPRGESSDLLNVDGKNDYDWLLTPPDTPLFPSLDDEPEPISVRHSSRQRSRPISISRSSTMERSQRSSRGSPSPQRLTPSPRSTTTTFRGRPSSAPHTGTNRINPVRSSTPTRRPSPPPLKPSTPPPRSLTPPSRRLAVGSVGPTTTSRLRASPSPSRSTRGNSASPKIRSWQSTIPGFSMESPPNLRTSLADRPATYVRGSSPASRTSPSRPGRQSMSPVSRSIGSSHSQERVSVASSGDDDADSLLAASVSVLRRGVGSGSGNRPVAFPKKPSMMSLPGSAPKRSFDSAMRQMDRRSPQNMFRPLLSSVPTSTFYSGKVTISHHRNSSVTTSSNASSDQPTNGAHDTEGSDQFNDETTSDCARTPFSDAHDEVFAFDKTDAVVEDTGLKISDPSSELQRCNNDSKEAEARVTSSEEANVRVDENSSICVSCGLEYIGTELSGNVENICPECMLKERISTNNSTESVHVMPQSQGLSLGSADTSRARIPEENKGVLPAEDSVGPTPPRGGSRAHIPEENERALPVEDGVGPAPPCGGSRAHIPEENEHALPVEDGVGPAPPGGGRTRERSRSDADVTEGAGISVLLLKRSNSVKGPLVLGRAFNGSAISYDDLSYARDLASSIGHGSMSTSSSVDLVSAKQMLTGKASLDANPKIQSTVSSSDEVTVLENAEPKEVYVPDVTERDEVDESQPLIARDEADDHHQVGGDGQTSFGIGQNMEELVLVEASVSGEAIELIHQNNDQKENGGDGAGFLSVTSEAGVDQSHPSTPRSQIETVSREDSVGPTGVTCPESYVEESAESDNGIVEESTVTVLDNSGQTPQTLTLEQAADTILFCRSIIHDLAYAAAAAAIDKQKENLEPLEPSIPTITIPHQYTLNFKDTPPTLRTPRPQKPRKKATQTDPKPLTDTDTRSNNENPTKPAVQNIGPTKNSDSMKPPKLESKCNCAIM